jgi:hypothetical protein
MTRAGWAAMIRDNDTYGAGLFSLADGTPSMEFVPIPGQTFRDAASGVCHSPE